MGRGLGGRQESGGQGEQTRANAAEGGERWARIIMSVCGLCIISSFPPPPVCVWCMWGWEHHVWERCAVCGACYGMVVDDMACGARCTRRAFAPGHCVNGLHAPGVEKM